jgi:hypothetical protein
MAFDVGHRPEPLPHPMQQEPIDWLEVVTRTIGVGLFVLLYVLWLGHQFTGVLTALGFS